MANHLKIIGEAYQKFNDTNTSVSANKEPHSLRAFKRYKLNSEQRNKCTNASLTLGTLGHDISEKANLEHTQLKIDYTFNEEDDPNRFYYRSDHYNFAKNNIPVIFYFSGTHEDYHKPGDTVDKIMYELLAKRTKLIFYTAWELANRPSKIRLNK